MCRQNQLWGCMLLAFGFGVLVGHWIEGGFFACCFGLGMMLIGCGMARKK